MTKLQKQARIFKDQRRDEALALMTYEELYQLFQFTQSRTALDRKIRDELHRRAYA